MNEYAIFIAGDRATAPCFHALLNSIDYYGISDVDVHLIYRRLPEDYINTLKKSFTYNLITHQLKNEDFNMHKHYMNNNVQFMQRSRYKHVFENSSPYKAIAILDADMMVVSHNFLNLFELVKDTRIMIAANERLKWIINDTFIVGDKPVFDKNTRLYKFHCNVPTFFDPNQWQDLQAELQPLLDNCFIITDKPQFNYHGKTVKATPDLFCWNIAIYKAGRQNDIVLMSSDVFTQVHYTNIDMERRLMKEEGVWRTHTGEEVFLIHGKIFQDNWQVSHEKNIVNKLIQRGILHQKEAETLKGMEKIHNHKRLFRQSLNEIRKEWYDLTFNHKVVIPDSMKPNFLWSVI